MKPQLLDLFSGAGGCARGYQRAGFYVVGVDHKPQPRYAGDEFYEADALAVLDFLLAGNEWRGYVLADFDAIHASPPCQAHSAMRTMPNARQHADCLPATRSLLIASGLPYVIENVVGAPMAGAVVICGAALGMGTSTHDLARHRLFETNFPLLVPPCSHGARPVIGFYGDHVRDARRLPGEADRRLPDMATDRAGKLAYGRDAMGIDWMEWEELTQAIPPVYTEHVGSYLLAEINARASRQAA